jgi:hypothetical protein
MSVRTIFAGEPLPDRWDASVYLCGPTEADPRADWRRTAVEALTRQRPAGGGVLAVLYPEPLTGTLPFAAHVEWEEIALSAADVIAFFVPRRMLDLPGLITNVKWGRFQESGRVVLGAPDDAERNGYLLHFARGNGVYAGNSVEDTMKAAVRAVSGGISRQGPLTLVPACVYRDPLFAEALARCGAPAETPTSYRCRYTRREGSDLGWRLDLGFGFGSADGGRRSAEVVKTLGSLVISR